MRPHLVELYANDEAHAADLLHVRIVAQPGAQPGPQELALAPHVGQEGCGRVGEGGVRVRAVPARARGMCWRL
jgi:hypothetical protein